MYDLRLLREEWIKNLESGQFTQGYGHLERDGKNCCLGVLCRTFDRLYPDQLTITKDPETTIVMFDGYTGMIPAIVSHAIDMRSGTGTQFTDLNDRLKLTFSQIAKQLRNNPERFFKD